MMRTVKVLGLLSVLAGLALRCAHAAPPEVAPGRPYVVVGTGQNACYDDRGRVITPQPGQAYYGQDAQFAHPRPAYRDQGDGTVTDLNTGLMWQQTPGAQLTFDQAVAGAAACRLGGYTDWRLPSIKELYSLIQFTGYMGRTAQECRPYLDTRYFAFTYGDERAGVRLIDVQEWSSTRYVGLTMGRDATVFGVNFADGRIKGYPQFDPRLRRPAVHVVRYVRGNPAYGRNDFVDHGDGTVTDRATGLTWQQGDSGTTYDWKGALAYAASLKLAGHSDWRVPNAKELQSLVDYTRAPAVTSTAAIDPGFKVTDREGWCWTSTTHLDGPPQWRGAVAVYVAFGRALGYMDFPPGSGNYQLLDVHGAGAQRSDPKSGDPRQYPHGRGPQGDQIRIYNYVRCVRGGVG